MGPPTGGATRVPLADALIVAAAQKASVGLL